MSGVHRAVFFGSSVVFDFTIAVISAVLMTILLVIYNPAQVFQATHETWSTSSLTFPSTTILFLSSPNLSLLHLLLKHHCVLPLTKIFLSSLDNHLAVVLRLRHDPIELPSVVHPQETFHRLHLFPHFFLDFRWVLEFQVIAVCVRLASSLFFVILLRTFQIYLLTIAVVLQSRQVFQFFFRFSTTFNLL